MHNELHQAGFVLSIFGPHNQDFYKIEKEIKNRKIDNLIILKNEIEGDIKKSVLLNTDLFIMTSRFEGHPMGLIEALAYGLPCIVIPGTNMAKEIKEVDAGWVCEGNGHIKT